MVDGGGGSSNQRNEAGVMAEGAGRMISKCLYCGDTSTDLKKIWHIIDLPASTDGRIETFEFHESCASARVITDLSLYLKEGKDNLMWLSQGRLLALMLRIDATMSGFKRLERKGKDICLFCGLKDKKSDTSLKRQVMKTKDAKNRKYYYYHERCVPSSISLDLRNAFLAYSGGNDDDIQDAARITIETLLDAEVAKRKVLHNGNV